MYEELCFGIMGYMDSLLAFQSIQKNTKEIRHKHVTPMQVPLDNFCVPHIVYKVQREEERGK